MNAASSTWRWRSACTSVHIPPSANIPRTPCATTCGSARYVPAANLMQQQHSIVFAAHWPALAALETCYEWCTQYWLEDDACPVAAAVGWGDMDSVSAVVHTLLCAKTPGTGLTPHAVDTLGNLLLQVCCHLLTVRSAPAVLTRSPCWRHHHQAFLSSLGSDGDDADVSSSQLV